MESAPWRSSWRVGVLSGATRSYIAGLGFAARLKKTELLLDDGTAIPISRRLFPEVNQAFVSYYLREEQEV